MKQEQFNKLARKLTQIFQGDKLNSIARNCQFMRRERKVEPFKLMLSIISAFASGKVESLADLQRSYNFLAEKDVAYKPFHNQLSKRTFADFMRQSIYWRNSSRNH